MSYSNPAQIQISTGFARNSDNSSDLVIASPQNVNITTHLDVGTETSNTWYHVFIIHNPVADTYQGLFSLSATAPTLPAGYTKFRRLGAIKNDLSSDFLEFFQFGNKNNVETRYVKPYNNNVLSAGSADTFTNIDLSGFVSPESTQAILHVYTDNTSGEVYIREDGAVTNWNQFIKHSGIIHQKTDSSQSIEYKVDSPSTDAYIDVIGFVEEL